MQMISLMKEIHTLILEIPFFIIIKYTILNIKKYVELLIL